MTGHTTALSTAYRAALAALGLLAVLALGACTTVEGTNAMGDFRTFEREVLNTTARGVGLIPGEEPKEDLTAARAPLVLPRNQAALPTPTTQAASAQLPVDSSRVQLDTANLSAADIENLRNARVVDLRSLSGRPLTEAEINQMTARMRASNMQVTGNASRPLYLPPAEYFTRVGDAQLVCRASNGDLVSLRDDRCPAEVRRALQSSGPSGSATTATPGARLTDRDTKL
ncbi:hypothetical protein VE26_01160 [Devosia chinhatensis]|uniref:Uncharacterized protein n=1 Tax=Devosia chinhatensis TaxID=429727 RepID=A0A0F5FIQ0_9HYPH|nr:hypothetical protein VE26_01160 [Devosia chinhatensis]